MNVIFRASFRQYERSRPDLYELLVSEARKMQKEGFKESSIWVVANRVRWYSNRTIHNDYLALYARLIMRRNPDLKGFFTLKRMKR